ncbi:hypothetical protein [Halococcus hamelinensis]|uniref:DUF8097 domain-containing protein n=1 Tax=Halococcus hamelinensis 100A6 TaxID=1132509 RepID=M0LYJ1_9EURY|nr:hypothetical protein [Halococcus hamelinensis]EMA38652.1 hypothetical protein C447_08945 [Halococcus hamelinensis 100A6]
MISRRTRARFEFLVSLCSIPVLVAWGNLVTDEEESSFPDPRWVGVGFVYRVAYSRAYDTDRGGLRTSRVRRAGVKWAVNAFARRLPQGRSAARWSFSLGARLGRVVYRLRYGVLGPVPDGEE